MRKNAKGKKFFKSKPLRCLLTKKLVIKKFYKNLSYIFVVVVAVYFSKW